MRTRALARAAASVDVEARTFSAILTTETPVRTYIPDPTATPDQHGCVPHIEVDEVLLTSGLDASRSARMPLLACHNTWSLDDYLGQVTAVRADTDNGAPVVAIDAVFKASKAEMASDLAAGFYPNLSAGYVVHEYEVERREGTVPLARAVRWTLLEASIVPVGADPNARVRSSNAATHPLPAVRLRASQTPKPRGNMDINELLTAAEDAIEKLEEAAERAGDKLDDDVAERIRKLRGETEEKPAERKREEDETAERKREEKDVESARSIAKTYGKDVVRVVDDLVALGTRASEIRAAVRSAVVARASSAPASGSVTPSQRNAPETLDTRAIYAAMNKR